MTRPVSAPAPRMVTLGGASTVTAAASTVTPPPAASVSQLKCPASPRWTPARASTRPPLLTSSLLSRLTLDTAHTLNFLYEM